MSTSQRNTYNQPSNTSVRRTDIDGQVFEIIGDRNASLAWTQSQGGLTIVPGGSNYSILSDFKGSILKLWNDFFEGKSTLDLSSDRAQLIKKRLFHLEHDIEGLLRRKIQFSVKDANGKQRFLDYTVLLNEKQVQIVELEKKIQNLEQRLRRASQREADLQAEITRLKGVILKLQKPGVSRADLEGLLRGAADYKALQAKYTSLRERFSGFGALIKSQSDKLRGSGITLDFEADLNALIRSEGMNVSFANGVLNVIDYKDRVVQVPVSDARTKHLAHMLAVQMKKFFQKYPKLRDQCDVRLAQFFQQQLIDIIEVDELDRVVQIVKYVPDVYRVQNVYAFSSQKSRKVQFHLRVLIKALLEELEKLKRKTGAVLDIDQGVIGMINAEIMDVVNVDDILKVFRVVPKIVQVEKIVQKIVDRVIQIPQVVPVQKIVQKIIEKNQIVEVQRIVHVPVEVIKYVDVHHDKVVTVQREIQKIVEVPRIIEKIVDRVVEIPKLVTQQVIKQKIIEVERPTIVEKIIHVPVIQYREVQVIKQKVVTVEKVVQKAVPVEVYVQKIVEKVVHVPQLVTVDKRNDVLVKQIQVQNARQVVNHIQRVPQIVQIVHQKPVPLIQTVQRIVQVPKVIQKIVEVRVQVPTVKQVKVVQQKIVYKQRVKQVEKVVTNTVQIIRQVEKIVERRVEVPIIQQKIVRVPEIITQVVVQKIENPVIVQVQKYVEKIVQVPKIIEVETVKIVQVRVDNPVKIIVEKIVEVPKTIERIKQVRVNIDKIIEKMVEVPKVVEIEKIVEKVVVVPRVIQKIVQVPQIVQKIVDRVIQNTKIVEVVKQVQVEMFRQVVKNVEIPVNTYITEKDVVQKIVQKIVPVQKLISTVQVVKETNDKIIEHRVEVPKEILVDRIVPVAHEVSKVVQVERQIVVPIEVPVPVDRVVQRVVHIERDVEKIVQVPQTIQKIVEVKVQSVKVETLVEKISVPIIREQIREIDRVVPYVQTQIKQVKIVQQKIVLNNVQVEKIVPVDRYIEKIVTQSHEIVKAKQVEKLVDRPIQVQKLITVENIVPVLVQVNRLVQVYRDRPIEIPLIHHEIKEVKVIEEKVVAIQHKDTQIKQVPTTHDRIIEQQKLITKTDIRNQIDTQFQVVDRYEDKIVPITTSIQKIVEVPYILEKIVEKIVIMPQVVEVLKYVHEIAEQQSLGVAVGVDVYTQQTKYKGLYGKLKVQFEALLVELRKMRGSNPALKAQIQIIQAFLIELDKLIAFPRIVQVEKEKQVEVQRRVPILVPTNDLEAERFQVTLAMIVSKLLGELMRIKQKNPSIKFDIDTQILKIFSDQYRDKSGLLQGADGKFSNEIHRIYGFYENFLNNLGGSNLSWEQQLIYTAALEQRLLVASLIDEANLQIQKAQAISDKRGQAFRVIKQSIADLKVRFGDLEARLGGSAATDANIRALLQQFRTTLATSYTNFETLGSIQPVTSLVQRSVYGTQITGPSVPGATVIFSHSQGLLPNWESVSMNDPKFFTLFESRFRALTKQNELLRQKYLRWQKDRPNVHGVQDRDRIIDNLEKRIVELQNDNNRLKTQGSVSVNVVGNTQQYEIKIRTLNSKIQQLESQLRTSKINSEGQVKSKDRTIDELNAKVIQLQEKLKMGDSRITGTGTKTNQYTPSSYGGGDQDRMSSSMHSDSKSSSSQVSDQSGKQYGNYATSGYKQVSGGSDLSGGVSGGASYGRQGATLSGSGVSYGQSGIQSSSYGQSGAQSGSAYGQSGQSGSSSYGQTGGQSSSYSSQSSSQGGSTVTYGQQGATLLSGSGAGSGSGLASGSGSGSGNVQAGYSRGGYSSTGGMNVTSGSSSTGGASYSGATGSGSGVGGSGYSSSSYSRNYGTTGATGATGTSSSSSGQTGTSGTSQSSSSYTRYQR